MEDRYIVDTPEGPQQISISKADEILKERHAEADLKFDDLKVIHDRARRYANPKCERCKGEGLTGLRTYPSTVESTVAAGGLIRVGINIFGTFCTCFDWNKLEVKRLSAENVRSSQQVIQLSQLTLQLTQEIATLKKEITVRSSQQVIQLSQLTVGLMQEIADLKQLSLTFHLRAAWRRLRSALSTIFGRLTSPPAGRRSADPVAPQPAAVPPSNGEQHG